MNRSTIFVPLLLLLATPLLAIATDAHATGKTARAEISGGPNGITGEAVFSEDAHGNVFVSLRVEGDPAILTRGRHGFHLHEIGICDPNTGFTSAGGHYDPGPFGNSNTVTNHPFHMGDMENIVVDSDGVGRVLDLTTRVSLDPNSDVTLFDADGSAVIVHAGEDLRDCQPDPGTGLCTGASGGARLACGVIKPD